MEYRVFILSCLILCLATSMPRAVNAQIEVGDQTLQRHLDDARLKEVTDRVEKNRAKKKGDHSIDYSTILDDLDRRAQSTQCEASMVLEYDQHDNEVKVDTGISTTDCDLSHGKYVIKVSLQSDTDEAKVLTFNEKWEINDAQDYTAQHSYQIGRDARLKRVRGSLSSTDGCWCKPEIPETDSE